jgi:dTDP-4-dehydrorhamnose 3,5-epimerase-like enzyme
VAHGLVNISKKESNMLYFVNQQFNIEDPDEYRLPWDTLGEDFWTPIKG